MRFIDSFNQNEPERHIPLDLAQPKEQIIAEIVRIYKEYEPEIITASGAEADYVLASLAQLPWPAAALDQPLLKYIRPEQLKSQHHIRIRIDRSHADYEALSEKFYTIDLTVPFEQEVQHLLNTYMLEPMDADD